MRTMLSDPRFAASCTAALAAAVLLAAPTPAMAQFGRVAGQVTEAETAAPLDGARIEVVGTSFGATTGAQGRFSIARVPEGTYTVRVSYLGRRTESREVTIASGETAEADFSLQVQAVVVGGVEVLGVRARGQAEALNRQKNASNIMNIVASDQMGRFPDASAPEAVQRLPGISISRDQGEGRFIQIRGAGAANTKVTLNGQEVPAPEGDVRQVALDAVPVDILESVEVSKAITPDMDADALGGSVNLVTKKAPEQTLFTIEGAGGYGSLRDEATYSGALTYGTRSNDGDVGFIISGSASRRDFGSDDVEPEYDLGDPGLGDDALEGLEARHYTLWRARLGATASLDFRLSENSGLQLTGAFAEVQDQEDRRNFVSAIEDGELAFEHKSRRENLRTFNAAIRGDHLLGQSVELDYSLGWSRSQEETPFDNEAVFLQEDVAFMPSIDDPDNVQANPSSDALTNPFPFDEVEIASSNTTDTDLIGSFDLAIPYQLGSGATGRLKFGAKIRDKDKDQEVVEEAAELTDGAGDIILGQDVGGPFDFSGYNPGDYPFPPNATSGDDIQALPDRFGSSLEREVNLEADTEDYQLDERVIAGYVMTEINVGPRFLLLPGVRYEHTTVDTEGFEFDPDAETLTPVQGSRDYGNVFPMLHVRYQLAERTNLRAAFTSTISRPNFFSLVPFRLRDDEDLELGNPDLDPTLGRSFDLLLEHYDRRIGVLSAGVFYKDLEDPIFISTIENELGGNTIQPLNGESGSIFGLELAAQQQLSGLPAPFDGLGVYANYTFTDSEAMLPSGREAPLAQQADHVFNAALSYEKSGFSSQISLNFRGKFIEEYGLEDTPAESEAADVWRDDHVQLDLSGSYLFTPQTSLFLELVNLTNEPLRLYQGDTVRPIQREFYETWGRLGLRYSM